VGALAAVSLASSDVVGAVVVVVVDAVVVVELAALVDAWVLEACS
jgi:hypothetical protein